MEAHPRHIQEVLLIQRLLGHLPDSLFKQLTHLCRQRERGNSSRGTLEQHIAPATGTLRAQNTIVLQVRPFPRSSAEALSPLLQLGLVSYQLIGNHYLFLGSGYMVTDNVSNGILC